MRLELDGLSYRYSRRQRLALSDVSTVFAGGVTGLLGPNGAGKTTLLNLLIGTMKPSSGSIHFTANNRAPSAATPTIGFLPQRFSFAGEMSLIDTVSYAAWVNGRGRRDAPDLATAALQDVGLSDKAGDRVRSLSGGQKQRLGIAATLAHNPDLLVLDEPTVGLDPGQRLRLRQVIADIGQTRPVILSTHLVEDVTHVCETVAVLGRGKLVFAGTPDELIARASEQHETKGLGTEFERAYVGLIDSFEDVS